jgi:hypothetical protein
MRSFSPDQAVAFFDNTSEAGMICGTAEHRASRNGGQRRRSPKMAGKSGFWTHVLDCLAVSGMICLSFRDRFDILLEKRPSGIAELRYTMLYGKSQLVPIP